MDNFIDLIYCKRINYIAKENYIPISGNPNENDQIYQTYKNKSFDEIISIIQNDNDENDPLKLKYNDLIAYLYIHRKEITNLNELKSINKYTIYKYTRDSEYDNKVNVYFNTLLEKYSVKIEGALDTALNSIKNTSYENIFKCFDIIVNKFNTIDSDETITKNNLNFLKNIFNDLHLTNQHLVDIDLPSDDSSIENADYPFFKKNNSNFSQKNIDTYYNFSLKRISIIKEKIKEELIAKCEEEKNYNEQIKNNLKPLEKKINQININDYNTLEDLKSALNEIYDDKNSKIKNKFQSKAYDYEIFEYKDYYNDIERQIDPLIRNINQAISKKIEEFIKIFNENINDFNNNSDFSYRTLIDINRIYLLSTGINIFIFSILDDKDISSDINVIITDKPFIKKLESTNIFNSYKIINSYIDKNLNYYESLVENIANKYYSTHEDILKKLNTIRTSTDEELLQESSFYFYLDKTITLDSDHIPKDHILNNKIVNIFTDTANSKKMFELLFNIFRKEE